MSPHSLWSLDALSPRDLLALLETARRLERAAQVGTPCRALRGKNIARLGDPGTADDGAFDRAATDLGAQVTRIGPGEPGLALAADLPRTARILGKLYDAIDCIGPVPHLLDLRREAGVPVFNGLAAATHPLRVLSSLFGLQAVCGKALASLVVVFLGDAEAPRGRALQQAAALAGIDLRLAPEQAQFVIDDDGKVHSANGTAFDGAAGTDPVHYTLQSLLLSTIV